MNLEELLGRLERELEEARSRGDEAALRTVARNAGYIKGLLRARYPELLDWEVEDRIDAIFERAF